MYYCVVVGAVLLTGSLANDSFSIAASIILFPLMIDVVQITIFRRAENGIMLVNTKDYEKGVGTSKPTFFFLRDKS